MDFVGDESAIGAADQQPGRGVCGCDHDLGSIERIECGLQSRDGGPERILIELCAAEIDQHVREEELARITPGLLEGLLNCAWRR
jgi:hypothetical protein